VDDRDVGDGDARWKGHEVVALSLGAEPSAEGWFMGGGDARPVHSTAQNPFKNGMAQREMCGKGGASHAVVGVLAVEGGFAARLHGGGNEGQDGAYI
jgi:hypothetical protein